MLTAYDVTATQEVTLEGDTSEPRTIFVLGRLDVGIRDWILNEFFEYGGRDKNGEPEVRLKNPGSLFTVLVRFGVKGWKNFPGSSGQDVPFDTVSHAVKNVGNRPGLSDKYLDYLQPYTVELGQKILEQNQLTGNQEKN